MCQGVALRKQVFDDPFEPQHAVRREAALRGAFGNRVRALARVAIIEEHVRDVGVAHQAARVVGRLAGGLHFGDVTAQKGGEVAQR